MSRDMNPFAAPHEVRRPKLWLGGSPGDRLRFELLGNLDPLGEALAKVRIYSRATGVITTRDLTITVHETEGALRGFTGDFGRAEKMPDSKLWEVYVLFEVGPEELIYGYLNEDLTPGGSAELAVYDMDGDTGETQTIHDNLLSSGEYLEETRFVWAGRRRADGRYYVLQPKGCASES